MPSTITRLFVLLRHTRRLAGGVFGSAIFSATLVRAKWFLSLDLHFATSASTVGLRKERYGQTAASSA